MDMHEHESWQRKLFPLEKRIKGFSEGYRQNIALLGDDGEEISYLLANYLKTDRLKGIIPIHTTTAYIDAKEFLKCAAFSLLSAYCHKADTLDNLINYTVETLPHTTQYIKETFRKNTPSFLDALEIINKFVNETGRKCLLIIEEFLELKGLFPQCFKDFSTFLILQRNCMVVLTSCNPRGAEKVLASELNLLFGNFETVAFNERVFLDNYRYLQDILKPLSPSPLFLSFFVSIVGDNIIYHDLISKAIKENYQPENEEASIVSVIAEGFFLKETYFFQKFINKIEVLKERFRDYLSIIKILIALSDGYLRKKELASLHICEPKELGMKLVKLCDLNYVENVGNIYKIKDTLFSFWLSHVFKFHFLPPLFGSHKRKILWRHNMYEEIAIFKEHFMKSQLNKVVELIASFKNDTLKSGRKRYTLPSVQRTKIISYPHKDFYILIGEGKEIIFAGIKVKDVEESDIFEFIERGKGINGKRVKKIFIALEKLSPTAKLVAKNHKLLLWDIDEINYLMRVYNKPIISIQQEQQRCES
ncbi:MAG: hypothetical protein JSW40_09100 [Candidatus Omnitrophota bacterium]|nr:MAG: hypothetical protein JSW40_09100 [Candidatus Omnitrophota bacterium]